MNKIQQIVISLSILLIVSLLISQTLFSDSKELRESGDYYSQRDVLTNDAGTGQDAGSNYSSAILIDSDNMTFTGDVSNPNDWRDVYQISPPDGNYICISLSWEGAFDLALGLASPDSSDWIVRSDYSGNYNPETVTHVVATDQDLYFSVDIVDETAGLIEYQITIYIDVTPMIDHYCQNDSGYGRDAYSGTNNHTEIILENSPGRTTINGFLSENYDDWDTYHLEIPGDKGLEARLYYDTNYADMKISMFQISNYGGEDGDALDFSYDTGSPEIVSSSGSTNYPGGIVENLVVHLWIGINSGEGEYTLELILFELDSDGDGVVNVDDAFPDDNTEWEDFDGDGAGDNSDYDDDNDGWSDFDEWQCQTSALDNGDYPEDNDNDGVCDLIDGDDDDDGIQDQYDDFPYENCANKDSDGDTLPDRITSSPCDLVPDDDDDGDSCLDVFDLFPLDSTECNDSDGDGVGDNADVDDDNDGWLDLEEEGCGDSDPLVAISVPEDSDNDGECDIIDTDDDNDSVEDWEDTCPGFNDNLDFDDDGQPDDCDSDDDGDGVIDESDLCQSIIRSPLSLALSISDDSIDDDQDGIPDGCDQLIDSDRDLTSDEEDTCEGHDDSLDVDFDGVPDACDAWHPTQDTKEFYLTAVLASVFAFSTLFFVFREEIR